MATQQTTEQAHDQAALKAGYFDRLQTYLKPGGARSVRSAHAFGRASIKAGLTTVDVAIVHEQAVILLLSERGKPFSLAMFRRSGRFLLGSLLPFETERQRFSAHNLKLNLNNEYLRQHAQALVTGNKKLQREVKRREVSEDASAQAHVEINRHIKESTALQQRLRHLTHNALNAQEEDRRQISRDLHDAIMQTLVGINMELAALGAIEKVGQRSFRSKLARTQRLIQQSVGTVHRFARNLRPAILDDLGLTPALLALINTLKPTSPIKINLVSVAHVDDLNCSQRTSFYRVIQEALTNAIRHSGATKLEVRFSKVNGGLRAEVIDNGKSFDPELIYRSKAPRRLGLVGMRERMEMIGGTLSILADQAKGTTVRADLPMATLPAQA